MTNSNAVSNEGFTRQPGGWRLGYGLLLIAAGTAVLGAAQFFNRDNWWAVFILLPALGLLGGAVLAVSLARGAFNLWARMGLSAGLVVLAVALMFTFDLNWDTAWPVMLIVLGLALMLNGFSYPRLRLGSLLGSAAAMAFWFGASVALLGAVFLFDAAGRLSLEALFGVTRWWSFFILLPGLGALLTAVMIYLTDGPGAGANSLLALAVMLGVAAAGETYALRGEWAGALALIAGGLVLLATGLLRGRREQA
ncbi:MAG: hypothetical protein ABI847_07475 [Anaerolineales bacterium]